MRKDAASGVVVFDCNSQTKDLNEDVSDLNMVFRWFMNYANYIYVCRSEAEKLVDEVDIPCSDEVYEIGEKGPFGRMGDKTFSLEVWPRIHLRRGTWPTSGSHPENAPLANVLFMIYFMATQTAMPYTKVELLSLIHI